MLLNRQENLEVVGEAADGPEAIELVTDVRPDVLILSSMLPMMDGATVANRVRHLTSTEVVILAASHNEQHMREAFENGARAYLLKSCDLHELVFAIRKAAEGEFYLSGPGGSDVISEYIKPWLDQQRPGGVMTQREKELARLLADGYSTKEAARVLNISPKTAETHRASIMKKLGAKNVTDIVKYCIRNYIIEP